MYRHLAAATALAALTSSTALGVVIYDESVDPELSDDNANPTALGTLSSGMNTLIGSFPGGGFARDAWSITIPNGSLLDSIILADYTPGTDDPVNTNLTLVGGPSTLLDTRPSALEPTPIGSNVTPGTSGDFLAGTYTFEMVEGGALDYALDFVVDDAPSGIIYNEAVDGDLGDDGSTPTSIVLDTPGANGILLNVGGDGDARDALTFTIPSGFSLESLILTGYSATGENDSTGLELYAGTDTSGTLLTSGLAAEGFEGDNLYSSITPPTTPFGPGDYTILATEFGAQTDIGFELNVVPEPTTLALLGLGGLATLGRRRAR